MAVVAAVAYLVGLGLDRGVVTPAMVAVGVAVVCLLVAGLGSRLRDDRETFGNVLVGLGAGGLYVDAVGANLYHGMLGGEATVAVCLAIGLATLAFGARWALPSFLGIGLFGGLVAATMPLSKGEYATSTGLFLLVTAPTFAVAAYRRWPLAAALAWGASFLAALPLLFWLHSDLALRLMPLDAALLMGLAAWTFAADPLPEADSQGFFPFVATCVLRWLRPMRPCGRSGRAHVAALGGVAAFLGYVFRSHVAGRRVIEAGLFAALAIAPVGLTPAVGAAVLSLFAIAEAILVRVARVSDPGGRAPILTAVQVAFGLGLYVVALAMGTIPDATTEVALLALLGTASVAAAHVVDRLEIRVASGAVVWALSTRAAILTLGLPTQAAITAAWIATFAGLLVVGFLRRRPELRQLALVVAAVTAGKVALVDLAGLDAAMKAVVLLLLGIVLLAGGYAYVRWQRAEPGQER